MDLKDIGLINSIPISSQNINVQDIDSTNWIIMHIILDGCETPSFILREEYELQTFCNTMTKKICNVTCLWK
jgi:hypothetical protein